MPLAWLCAQDNASRLLEHSGACWHQASFEYRAVHHVLALTMLFSRPAGTVRVLSRGDFDAARALVADDVEWALWCRGRFASDACELSAADREPALRAFRGLTASRLLGGSLDEEALGACAVAAARHGAGVSVGVTLARSVLEPSGHRCHFGPGPETA